MAKMGLSVRDDPPRVVDLTGREWGETVEGLALSVAALPSEDRSAQPSVSVVIRNLSAAARELQVPGWLHYYEFDVRLADGTPLPMSPFGRELMKRQADQQDVTLAPGGVNETQVPVGSIFGLRTGQSYRVKARCRPQPGFTVESNEIRI